MWVFGYGSLIWKVDFPYERKLVGYIKGYIRRFYQMSTDHRGVPSKPGRVVTLLASNNPDDQVWGVAYKIATEDIDRVVNHLDFREKGGYERKTVFFYPCNPAKRDQLISNNSAGENTNSCVTNANDSSRSELISSIDQEEEKPFHLTIYIGSEDNPNFAGAEDIETIASHIIEAHGPSGANTEYLYKLSTAMKTIMPGIVDDHLFALETAVRRLDDERNNDS